MQLKQTKEFIDNVTYLNMTVLQMYYKIDYMITKLKFFTNIYKARQEICKGNVLVNFSTITHNYILKKGDVITVLAVVDHKLILNFILNSGENVQINRPVALQTDHPKLLFFSCFHFVKLKII